MSSFVTLLDEDVSSLKIVSLENPATKEQQPQQDYVLINDSSIYELNSLNQKYSSFLIGSRVISNGALHVATKVDPLFFWLPILCSQDTKWQPLDQLDGIPPILQSITPMRQLLHLCKTNDQLGEEMLLYKFNEARALKWLSWKQSRAFEVLKAQSLAKQHKSPSSKSSSSKNSSVSGNFCLADDSNTAANTPTVPSSTLSSAQLDQIKDESIQVVCEYLSPEWRHKLLSHLGASTTLVVTPEKKKQQQKRPFEEESSEADKMMEYTHGGKDHKEAAKPKKEPAKSAGLKRLQKVSTKGMKSLSSFFGATKKKAKMSN